MKRPTPFALLLLCAAPLLAGQTAPPADAPQPSGRAQRAYANPSALIAADIALARLARAKGQWSALRELADDDASLFDPARTPARPALKDRADPPQAAQWEPRAAWISCDGSFGLTWGGWTAASGTPGEYATVWKRQVKGKVDWKWQLTDRAMRDVALPVADWAEGRVADCPPRRPAADNPDGSGARPAGHYRPRDRKGLPPLRPLAGPLPATDAPAGADSADGQSRDGTLAWRSTVLPDGTRRFTAWIWKDGAMREVLSRRFSAEGA